MDPIPFNEKDLTHEKLLSKLEPILLTGQKDQKGKTGPERILSYRINNELEESQDAGSQQVEHRILTTTWRFFTSARRFIEVIWHPLSGAGWVSVTQFEVANAG